MRFVVLQDQEETSELPWEKSSSGIESLPMPSHHKNKQVPVLSLDDLPVSPRPTIPETQFPASVSIEVLLQFEKFNIESGAWENAMNVDCEVEGGRFSSGAFRDAFHISIKHGEEWVLKTYNQKAKKHNS